MGFDYVLLKTDLLFYILILAAIGYALYASRHEHLLAPWKQVVRRPLGMSAAVILAVYLIIAVLDSIHFYPAVNHTGSNGEQQYATEIISLFDQLVGPLRTHQEKTYSAPFATRLYGKETVRLPGGGTLREYPRLKYGGAQLDDPATEEAAALPRCLPAT